MVILKKLFILMLVVSFIFASCGDDIGVEKVINDSTITEAVEEINPIGTIQGLLVDRVTFEPIVGAVIDIGLKKATTSESGQFIFSDIPATSDAINKTVTGEYQLTIDLSKVKKPIDTTAEEGLKYPGIAYTTANVNFTAINNNAIDSNSNHDTSIAQSNRDIPVTKLIGSITVYVGKLAAKVNGLALFNGEPVESDFNVKISSIGSLNTSTGRSGNVVAETQTDTDGRFNFINLETLQQYKIVVTGYNDLLYGELNITTPADNQTLTMSSQNGTAVNVQSIDQIPPTIVSVTPEDESEMEPGEIEVEFKFSESLQPVDINKLIDHIKVTYLGERVGNSGSSSYISFRAKYTDNYDSLTVAISNSLTSSKYSFDIRQAATLLHDSALNSLININEQGYGIVTIFTSGGVETNAPEVTLSLESNLNWKAKPRLDWSPVDGAVCYSVYRKKVLHWGSSSNESMPEKILNCGVGSNYVESNYIEFVTNQEIKTTYFYNVTSTNSDTTESSLSNNILVKDETKIKIQDSSSYLNDFINGDNTFTIRFDEWINESTAEIVNNYTLNLINDESDISVTSASYYIMSETPVVKLYLSSDIETHNIEEPYINSGSDGICDSYIRSNDTEIISRNKGETDSVCINLGTAAETDPDYMGGDDKLNSDKTSILSGSNGICESDVPNDNTTDTQVIIIGNGKANSICLKSGNDFRIDSQVMGDDVDIYKTILTVSSGVKDVAGNTFNNEANEITLKSVR